MFTGFFSRRAMPRRPRRARQPTGCTMNSCFFLARNRSVPMLRLRGLWLEAIGLSIGCRLSISAERGKLVVTLIPPAPVLASPPPRERKRRASPTST